MLDVATTTLAIASVLVPCVSGAFWLSRVEHKANTAIKDLLDLEQKIIPALMARVDKMEAHTTDIAILTTKMETVLTQLEGLSASMQLLLNAQARAEGRAEGHI
jgi:Tfp pilus assembly protein PilN